MGVASACSDIFLRLHLNFTGHCFCSVDPIYGPLMCRAKWESKREFQLELTHFNLDLDPHVVGWSFKAKDRNRIMVEFPEWESKLNCGEKSEEEECYSVSNFGKDEFGEESTHDVGFRVNSAFIAQIQCRVVELLYKYSMMRCRRDARDTRIRESLVTAREIDESRAGKREGARPKYRARQLPNQVTVPLMSHPFAAFECGVLHLRWITTLQNINWANIFLLK
ncbi:hypothetical protein C8R45DRAFT_935146 [Mycena sanguinolenta]|nr:hypothetical protein C8R45DRAFT_935146 [Mycena sanguinolenta]